jgi:hypothetical protein
MDKKSLCIGMLTGCAEKLGRLPKKSDFDMATVTDIKQNLGPWPRALETAGLKPISIRKRKPRKYYRNKP